MSDLVAQNEKALITFSTEQTDLIKRTIAKDATEDELKLFLYQCQRTGLDPLSKQIFFTKHKNNKTGEYQVTFITAIDGYRGIADRTGKYAGSDDPVFDNENEPNKATATVYKLVGGIRCAFVASARWAEYYPGDAKGFMWKKMPCNQLGKCAEALALRKAFPHDLSGLYVKEEMDQADNQEVKNITPTVKGPIKYDPSNKEHREQLAIEAKKFSEIKKEDLIKLSNFAIGTPMEELNLVVEDFVELMKQGKKE